MWRALAREAPADGASYSTRTQGVAMAVIALWLGAIVAGRMIAYTLTPVFGS
jgi:hypothetical protein